MCSSEYRKKKKKVDLMQKKYDPQGPHETLGNQMSGSVRTFVQFLM